MTEVAIKFIEKWHQAVSEIKKGVANRVNGVD